MIRLALLLGLFCSGFLTDTASAQVFINPPGGSISPGGTIHVDNWTPDPVLVEIKLDDGTVIATDVIPGMGWRDYEVPNSADLIGRKITIDVTQANGTVTSETYQITMPDDDGGGDGGDGDGDGMVTDALATRELARA